MTIVRSAHINYHLCKPNEKKSRIFIEIPNKTVPLHPVKTKATADIAQLVEQRIRNA